MAKLYNLARMTTSTTGTGTITLGSAATSYLSFASAGVQNGDVVTYAIVDGNNREIGRGTYTSSGTTLSRDTILDSTNGGSAINLSGSAEVFITAAGEDITSDVAITGGSISGITDLAVADGGTGASSFNAYGIVTGGTTGTGALQSLSSTGTSGQVLTSNGASSLPTWQDAAGGSSPWVQITAPTNVTAVTNLDIVWDETLYSEVKIVFEGIIPASDGADFHMYVGYNNGGTFVTSTSYINTVMGSAPSVSQGQGRLISTGAGSAAGETTSAIVDVISPNKPVGTTVFVRTAFEDSGGSADSEFRTVYARVLQTIDSIRFFWNTGNFEAAGTYAVYGLKRTV